MGSRDGRFDWFEHGRFPFLCLPITFDTGYRITMSLVVLMFAGGYFIPGLDHWLIWPVGACVLLLALSPTFVIFKPDPWRVVAQRIERLRKEAEQLGYDLVKRG